MKQKNIDVAVGLQTWNGKQYISTALSSLLNQTYKNYKIFIHHNNSNIETLKIINKFKKKYPNKICIVKDKVHREIPEAIEFLCKKKLRFYKYMMMCGDDDIWHKNFISDNLKNLKEHDLDLSYPLLKTTKPSKIYRNFPLYSSSKGLFKNLLFYLLYRNIVPLCFGIFKTKKFLKNLNYYMYYDESKTNYDNIFGLACILNLKIGFTKKKLFTYRIKDRDKISKKKDRLTFDSFIYQILIFKFQFNFSVRAVSLILKNSNMNIFMKLFFINYMILLYIQKVSSFIIKRNMIRLKNLFI
jgi:glycosyltransferase involved in cell wall biosynthesis